MKTRTRILLSFLLGFWAPARVAHADSLSGIIDDPALRRTIDLVYLERVEGTLPSPAEVLITQKGLTFLPHVNPIVAGTRVIFKSEDPELHNVFARGPQRPLFNQAVMPDQQFARVFDTLGPVHLTCNIHKEMSAWVVVLQNPFYAQPDKAGRFTITGVPPGQYRVGIWGEALEPAEQQRRFPATVNKKGTPLRISRLP